MFSHSTGSHVRCLSFSKTWQKIILFFRRIAADYRWIMKLAASDPFTNVQPFTLYKVDLFFFANHDGGSTNATTKSERYKFRCKCSLAFDFFISLFISAIRIWKREILQDFCTPMMPRFFLAQEINPNYFLFFELLNLLFFCLIKFNISKQ